MFCDATNKKIPTDKLVTCELPFVALEGADVKTPYADAGIISPARETGISHCRIPLETTFRDSREGHHTRIPSHSVCRTKKNALVAFGLKSIRNKKTRSVVRVPGVAPLGSRTDYG